ncbi:unnamed protein product [Sphagnum tenellum]
MLSPLRGFAFWLRLLFGYNTVGVGHYVSADKAAKLAAKWAAKEKVRSLEHSLKVARQISITVAVLKQYRDWNLSWQQPARPLESNRPLLRPSPSSALG